MGRDYGTNYTKGDMALGCFLLWLVGGWVVSFVLAFILFPKPNFLFLILFYFVIGLLLLKRYLKIDKEENKKWKKKNLNNYWKILQKKVD